MNYIHAFIPALMVTVVAISCKKDKAPSVPLSAITITNVVVKGITAKLGSNALNISNNGATQFTLNAGSSNLYVWPAGDSLHPYYHAPLTTANRDIYTLFLTGTPDSIESLLIREDLPYRSDSSFGVRFINLSPGSPAVKVTLSGSTTTSEFGDVAYKGMTAFKSYSALSTNTTYTFQVRNAATNALISSITLSGAILASGLPRFNNITLVLRGKVGSTPAAGITRVNHF